MYPAAQSNFNAVLLVSVVFGLTTIVTMLSIVLVATSAMDWLPSNKLEPYKHAIAGGTIFLSGMAIQILGL